MSNKEIFSRTFGFSFRRFFFDVLAFVVMAVLSGIGYYIAEQRFDNGLIGLLIGLVVGLIIVIIVLRYVSYAFKAGQIAMMTEGITKGELPDNVIKAGKQVVKERFATVAVFFAVTGIIKGIFNQIGNAITRVGEKVGGNTGNTVGSAISMVIQVIVAYLCDCCLGWVFYRKDQKPARATCEGAVLFFKHGKTFAKNMGRIFGMGLVSLLIIGGAFGGIFYLIGMQFPEAFAELATAIREVVAESSANIPEFFMSVQGVTVIAAAAAGLILWSILHGAFIRPLVLTGVLRNYLEAGMNDIPTEESFKLLDSKSAKFKKLHGELA